VEELQIPGNRGICEKRANAGNYRRIAIENVVVRTIRIDY
jgi:hypothetical protein